MEPAGKQCRTAVPEEKPADKASDEGLPVARAAFRLQMLGDANRGWRPRGLLRIASSYRCSQNLETSASRQPTSSVPWWLLGMAGALGLATFWNLNGVCAMAFDRDRFFSGAIGALVGLVCALQANWLWRATAGPGRWFLAFFFYFTLWGNLLSFAAGSASTVLAAQHGLSYVAAACLVLAMAVIGLRCAQTGALVRLLAWLFWLSVISSLTGLVDAWVPAWGSFMQYRTEISGRWRGVFENPNELGIQCGYTLALGASVAVLRGKVWVFIVGMLAAVAGAFITGSKTAYLLLTLQCPVAACWVARRFARIQRAVILLLGLGLAVGMLTAVPFLLTCGQTLGLDREALRRLGHLNALFFEGAIDDTITTYRFSQWTEAVQLWSEAPLLGHGFGSTSEMPRSGLGPHNTLLLIAAEAGIGPASLFLAAWYALLTATMRARAAPLKIFVGLCAMVMVAAITTTHNWLDDRNHNFMLGLCLGWLAWEHPKPKTQAGPEAP